MPAPKKVSKPDKPQDCPLFAHNNGQWCKKVRGRLRYFGPWSDLNAALQEYYRQKPYLEAGRLPPPPGDDLGPTLKDVANKWLDFQSKRVDAGDLRPRTWTEYKAGAGAAIQTLGSHMPVETIKPAVQLLFCNFVVCLDRQRFACPARSPGGAGLMRRPATMHQRAMWPRERFDFARLLGPVRFERTTKGL